MSEIKCNSGLHLIAEKMQIAIHSSQFTFLINKMRGQCYMKAHFDLGYTVEFSCVVDNKLSVKSYFIFYCSPVNGS